MLKELDACYSQTNSKKKKTEANFVNECEKIDKITAKLLEAHTYAGFEMKDGKIEINKANAFAAERFMQEAVQEQRILKGKFKKSEVRKLNRKVKKLGKIDDLSDVQELELLKAQDLLQNNASVNFLSFLLFNDK